MPQLSQWTPEMDAVVATGFRDKLSARLIGERLGVSRNAVLGRHFRLGLAKPSGKRTRRDGCGLLALGHAARACGFTVAKLQALRKELQEDGL